MSEMWHVGLIICIITFPCIPLQLFDSSRGKDADRESMGSAEGSTTDSGRGASEEGEHGDHDRSM